MHYVIELANLHTFVIQFTIQIIDYRYVYIYRQVIDIMSNTRYTAKNITHYVTIIHVIIIIPNRLSLISYTLLIDANQQLKYCM